MEKREKQKNVFMSLVNKQLEPFGATYEDVKDNPNWYMEYKTTNEEESKFIQWGTKLIQKELKLSKSSAQMEMSWFILQWGLTTTSSDDVKHTITEEKTKKAK